MAFVKIEIKVEYDPEVIEITQMAMETAKTFGFEVDYEHAHVVGISVQEEK